MTDIEAIAGRARRPLRGLWRRIVLTWQYRGPSAVIWRIVTFPLRFTPLRRFVLPRGSAHNVWAAAAAWYREHGEPVDVVIPSYRDADLVTRLVASIRRTTPPGMVRIIVADDASGGTHLAQLHAIEGIEIVAGEHNKGFAANVNRGLRATDPARDVVVLNSDTEAQDGWLACLQYGARAADDIGIVGAKLLYPDGRIQFGGTVRNLGAPEWFDHRFRFRTSDYGPANIVGPSLAVTGACMYLARGLLDDIGLLDEAYPMAYEDVDFSLRAWTAGYRVMYLPLARLLHFESESRGTELGERERTSQIRFWERWGDFFDARDVRTHDGRLRVIYVTEDTGVGGGHREVFEHLNGLARRGHAAELYTLGSAPEWFDLDVPVRTFADYDELVAALAPQPAIKVATWWNTAEPVWRASVLDGIPVYFVQDIETSYYPDDELVRSAVLASYRHEFRYMTTSEWNRRRLRDLGLDAAVVPCAVDSNVFRPLEGGRRRDNMVVALGRTNPLKNFPLTLAAWRRLEKPRPELCLFGIEPELAQDRGCVYVDRPTDARINELLNEATVFVQTSRHEGFSLPVLEAMATGAAVVCTDAHGNRDYCRDGENCLMPEPNASSVCAAIARVLRDPGLRRRLGRNGLDTARVYNSERRTDALETFLNDIATRRRVNLDAVARPAMRKAAR